MSERNLIEVYRAKDSFHAHLLQAALKDAGIPALIEGELLQGVLGEVPVWPGAPRIMVEGSDVERAREVIAHAEEAGATAPAEADVDACLACGAPMREEDEACPACGWEYNGAIGAEGNSGG